MGHHKRKKPKSSRSGCLLCKPHKANHCGHTGKTDGLNMRNLKRRQRAVDEMSYGMVDEKETTNVRLLR